MVKKKTACFVTERDEAENNFISISIVETCPIVINIFVWADKILFYR